MYVFVFWFQICIINKNEFLIVNYCNPPTLLSFYQITAREQISDKRGLMAVRVNVIRGSAIRMMKSKRCYSWLKWSIDVTMINRIVIWAVFGEIGLEISVIKHTDQQKVKKGKNTIGSPASRTKIGKRRKFASRVRVLYLFVTPR